MSPLSRNRIISLLTTAGALCVGACGFDQSADGLGIEFPTTCAEVQSGTAHVGDGEYTLYADGDPAHPWQAYCDFGGGQARAYLTLPSGDGINTSRLRVYDGTSFTTVQTGFERVRVDPTTLEVDLDDRTFARSVGTAYASSYLVKELPFGVAAACSNDPALTVEARAGIDLGHNPFVIDGAFCTDGGRTANSRADVAGTKVTLSVAPDELNECAVASIDPCLAPPYAAGTHHLRLAYQP